MILLIALILDSIVCIVPFCVACNLRLKSNMEYKTVEIQVKNISGNGHNFLLSFQCGVLSQGGQVLS